MRRFVALAVAVTSGLVLFPLWALALGDVARTGGLRLLSVPSTGQPDNCGGPRDFPDNDLGRNLLKKVTDAAGASFGNDIRETLNRVLDLQITKDFAAQSLQTKPAIPGPADQSGEVEAGHLGDGA